MDLERPEGCVSRFSRFGAADGGAAVAVGDILDYSEGTMLRSGEAAFVDSRAGWRFVGASEATNYKLTNVPRIFTDGAVLIEGSRTNRMPDSSDTTVWTGSFGTPLQVTGLTGPDLSTDAVSIEDDSNGQFEGRFENYGAAPSSTPIAVSCYLVKDSITSPLVGYQWIDFAVSGDNLNVSVNTQSGVTATVATSGVTGVSHETNDADLWWRLQTRFTTGATASQQGRIALRAGALSSSDQRITTHFVGQVEHDASYISSPIRTSGGVGVRAAESLLMTVGVSITAGAWVIDVSPTYASADANATHYIYFIDADNHLAIIGGTTLRLRAGGVNEDIAAVSFTAHEKLTITVDFPGNLMTLVGGGDGSVVLANDWTGTSMNVGSDSTPANHFDGVISPPRNP